MVNKMLALAAQEGVLTSTFPLSPPLYGVYLENADTSAAVIGLSTYIQNESEKRCIMAEELGHHFTSAGICIPRNREFYCYSERTEITRTEYKALKWAANYLIPEHDLLDAIKSGLYEPWELAEHFDVTNEFAAFRLRLFGVKTLT
ncbi:Zn-dependent peptidase ImmA (M78 family) [Sporomusaceae bacterium BoRhaA]|uniref:ImmA/IrrE family metallo-endopeptidase n=1 Tax=Pelorhabdus rhamnosifermentans TaxID=2772457 RepID=UPI001C063636|nr:ImmA/IrrE family metallo-endopeptidase [Pelorhabdus rhamnosifermentans]MBU2703651.1 Zn-dependent peptidase ImmA (M78 family) [Pelorhabdus rhamnosifermentans]